MLGEAFPYYQLSHRDWAQMLGSARFTGTVLIDVPWGVHETNRGRIDTASASKLNLERLFSTLHSSKKSVHLRLGFHGLNSVPRWAWETDTAVIVPGAAFSPVFKKYVSVRVPDYRQPEVRESYCLFLDEVMAIADLYRSPGGPIEAVSFDPGFFRHVWSIPNVEDLTAHLLRTYGDIKKFNAVFGVSNSEISGAGFLKRLAVLMDRRAWIACSDLRTVWRASLANWLESLQLDSRKVSSLAVSGKVICASECSELIGQELLPYCPDGVGYSAVLKNHRTTVGYFQSLLGRHHGVVSHETCPDGMLRVICEKWIRRSLLEQLKIRAQSGVNIEFMPSPPVYDEKMEVLKEFVAQKREPVETPSGPCFRLPLGMGSFWWNSSFQNAGLCAAQLQGH